jgi:hypothetical protein
LDEQQVLEQLEELASRLGIKVRYETIRKEAGFYPGGLCRLKGEPILIVNKQSTPKERTIILSKALKRFDLTQVYLRPGLREFLDRVSE